MRGRVLGVLATLLCVVMAIICTVLLQGVIRDATADVQLNRLASLNRFVQLAANADTDSDRSTLQLEMDGYTDLFGEDLLVTVDGTQLVSGDLNPADPTVARIVRNAGLNLEQSEIPQINPFDRGTALIARPFGNSAQVLGAVAMEVDLQPARSKILLAGTLILFISLSVCLALLILANRLSSWVLRPVHELSEAVSNLARTQSPVPLEEAGPRELRELSRSFSNMARVMTDSLHQQQALIAETSHQLRNPIAALRLRVDLLKLRLGNRTDADGVQAVEKELLRVELLLDGVLRLASAEHRLSERDAKDSAPIHGAGSSVINAARMLAEEIERQSAAAREVQSRIELDLSAPEAASACILCNEFELQQMLAELLENAFKYAPGTLVRLSVIPSGDFIKIGVRDFGRGLSPTDVAKATDRFWRAEQVRRTPGTGLGMTIVDRLVRANFGRFELATAEGGGLQVSIFLPQYEPSLAAENDGVSHG